MCGFGFTVVWTGRIVCIRCKSFLHGTEIEVGAWGTYILLNEVIGFGEGRARPCLVLLLVKSCSLCQRNSGKKRMAPMLNSSAAINPQFTYAPVPV